MLRVMISSSQLDYMADYYRVMAKLLEVYRQPGQLDVYRSPHVALQRVREDPYFYDILAITLTETENIELACQLRSTTLQPALIFIVGGTNVTEEYMYLRPSLYYRQDESLHRLARHVRQVFQEVTARNRFFWVKNQDEYIRIPWENIDYFEKSGRKVMLHTQFGRVQHELSAPLDEIEGQLPQHLFFRCHQSVIVHFRNVRRINKVTKQCVMASGAIIDISRRNYTETLRLFDQYTMEYKVSSIGGLQ